MAERPGSVVLASLLALLGAFFALAVTIIGLDIGAEGMLTRTAFGLLTLALFLAVAGSLNANGQWSWNFLIFAEALCAAVPIIGFAYGSIDALACMLLAVIAVIMIMVTSTSQVKRWVDADRI